MVNYDPGVPFSHMQAQNTGASLLDTLGSPEALGTLGTVTGIAGTLIQGKGAIQQAKAIQAAAEYNAAIAELQGIDNARRIRRTARRTLSSQYVQMAGKSGVIAESGGWLEVLVSNAAAFEIDAVNASVAARRTAELERHRGQVARAVGKQQRTATLISGAASLAGQIARLA